MYDSTFLILIPAIALALYAQFKVQSTFRRYSEIPSGTGYTGAQVAAELLRRRGITDVKVEPVQGMLGDHYDPRTKVLRLSPDVYGRNSLAAIGVAAHEAGHAVQHREGYTALALRSAIVPVATIGTSAAWILFIIGWITSSPNLVNIGILLFLGYIAFAMITLP
ncbi:MAG: zinc metallopeptidase, partial [bacterium]